MENTKENTNTIDAQGKSLGRVASEAAKLLMGKNRTDFSKNNTPGVVVTIVNAAKVNIRNKKLETRMHKTYSGYPGGLTETPLKKVIADKGHKEVFRHAVKGMLPTNKLRDVMMKNLIITD